jgi:hypothetical protein
VSKIEKTIAHLERNQWVEVTGRGQERWVTFGARTRRVFGLEGGAK